MDHMETWSYTANDNRPTTYRQTKVCRYTENWQMSVSITKTRALQTNDCRFNTLDFTKNVDMWSRLLRGLHMNLSDFRFVSSENELSLLEIDSVKLRFKHTRFLHKFFWKSHEILPPLLKILPLMFKLGENCAKTCFVGDTGHSQQVKGDSRK